MGYQHAVFRIQTIFCKKSVLSLLALALVSAAWRSYPRLQIPRMFPSDEYTMIGYVLDIYRSDFDILNYPPLELLFIRLLNAATGINIYTIMFFINPVIGGLTVIPFYFLVKNIFDAEKAFLASVLFAFSETAFYRTSFFGTTEASGMFVMLVCLYFYFSKSYIFSAIFFGLTPFAHIVPALFNVVAISADLLLRKRYSILSCMFVIMLAIALNPLFPPHRFVAAYVPASILHSFSFSNLFLYSLTEMAEVAPYFMGLTSMLIICAFNHKLLRMQEKVILFLCIVLSVLSLLFYNSRIISPMRFFVYMSIPLTLSIVNITQRKIVTIALVVTMIISPVIGGAEKFTWYQDSISQEEMTALEWCSDSGHLSYASGGSGNWFADTPVKQYISLYWGGPIYLEEPNYNYVLISPRMEKQSYFIYRYGISRTVETRVPIADVWSSNTTFWRLIYNVSGVKVYVRVLEND